MDQSQTNVSKLRDAYHEWNRTLGQSVETWLDMMHDDIRMHSLAEGGAGIEFTRPHDGKLQAREYFAELNRGWEMIYFHAEEFIAQGDQVVMIGKCGFRSRQTGKVAESPKVDIHRFQDGLIIDYREFYDTAKAFAACLPDGDGSLKPVEMQGIETRRSEFARPV